MGVKLGQKWAVKDGNLLASNQVGSRFFNKEFDFSRASNGTYVDRDGLLKTAELYNKIEYSQNFQSGTYGASNLTIELSSVISPDGFKNAYKLIPTAANGVHLLTDITINNAVYSVFAKQGGYKRFRFNTGSSSDGYATFDLDLGQVVQSGGTYYIDSGIEDYGNGWYRCYLAIGATSGTTTTLAIEDNSGSVTFIGDGTSSIYVYGMQVVEGTEPLDYQYTNGLQGLPRISFEDGVGHLLLEPQRSNLLRQSNSFNTTWSTVNASVTSGQNGGYGSNDAWLLSKSAAHSRLIQSVSFNGLYTFSVYAKANDSNHIRFYFDNIAVSVYFNLIDGSLGSTYGSEFVSGTSQDVGNGWWRFSIVMNGAGTGARIYPAQADNDVTGTSGSIYIQHAQLESGSYPTSIIETTTTQITRLADVCNNSGSAQDFNSEEGMLYAEILKRQDDNDNYVLISINDNSGNDNNSVTIGFDNEDDFYARIKSYGTTNLLYTSTTANKDQFYKMALRYKSGENALYIDGVKVFTTSSTITFSNALSRLDFAYNSAYGLPFYGKVRNLQVFTEALSDAELQQLTT